VLAVASVVFKCDIKVIEPLIRQYRTLFGISATVLKTVMTVQNQ